jgi:diketogulonate reductase-like aldo/keto reductase
MVAASIDGTAIVRADRWRVGIRGGILGRIMETTDIPRCEFADGTRVPALGQGTWTMGESAAHAGREVSALRAGLDLGLTLIDTAEMYGDGGAERIVGKAIAGRRDEVFLVSKVYPQNAGRKSLPAACEASLARLGVDHVDLYLLHWRGRVPLTETVDAFEALVRAGKILRWGVSNFDADDMAELAAVPGGERCATNQVCYHLGERGVEWDLLPWMRARRMPLMAYSPLGQADLLRDPRLIQVAAAERHTPAQLALAWTWRDGGVITIPQTANLAHLRENRGAAGLRWTAALATALDRAFPPPTAPSRLAVL